MKINKSFTDSPKIEEIFSEECLKKILQMSAAKDKLRGLTNEQLVKSLLEDYGQLADFFIVEEMMNRLCPNWIFNKKIVGEITE